MKKLLHFVRDESGVTAIEYAFIAALVAVAIIVSVTAVGTSLDKAFADVAASFPDAAADSGGGDGGDVSYGEEGDGEVGDGEND